MNGNPRLDLLACMAHPDDAETACGGLLAKLARRGYRVGVCDLTRGERASNGTPEIRQREAEQAAAILQLEQRFNLGLPDGELRGDDAEQHLAVLRLLRRVRPRVVVVPGRGNRHPDHAATRALVQRAQFFVAVAGFDPDTATAPRPVLLHALDYHPMQPSFIVDISDTLDIKMQAIRSYRSQFEATSGGAHTVLNDPAFLQRIQVHATAYGQRIGCAAGEPYWIEADVPLEDPIAALAPSGKVIP
jgi:bacillithiol biosynthesis deacetylase BshB1